MNHDDRELLQIECGTYLSQYLIYTRKSTDDADNQRNSIKYQRATNLAFAVRERLSIAPVSLTGFCTDGVISEHHSGFKESVGIEFSGAASVAYRVERPKFYQLAELLSQRRFKGVIFLTWDRASRNKADDVILQKLMRLGVDVRFALAQYDNTSSGALHMDIDSAFAAHHSRVTSEKVRLALAQGRRDGLHPNKAPIGYLDTGTMELKRLDPERAPIIRRLFELAGSERWTLAALNRWAIGQGLTMPPIRTRRTSAEILEAFDDDLSARPQISRPPTKCAIHRILTNPFYMGKVRGEAGEWVPSRSHEALVDEELFWRVQARLSGRRVSAHYPEQLTLPYRGFVRCGCERLYTPYQRKAWVYLGVRCLPACTNTQRNLPTSRLEEALRDELHKVELSTVVAEALELSKTPETTIVAANQRRQEEQERRAKRLRADQAYLTDNRLLLLRTGAYTADGILQEEAKIASELAMIAKAREEALPETIMAFASDVLTAAALIRERERLFGKASQAEREAVARALFVEARSVAGKVQFVPKPPFGDFFDVVPGAPSGTPVSPNGGVFAGPYDDRPDLDPGVALSPPHSSGTSVADERGLVASPYSVENFLAENVAICAGSARLPELMRFWNDLKQLIATLSSIVP